MGQSDSRAISDAGAFMINLIENPTKTISTTASDPKGAIYATQSTVMNEGEDQWAPKTNTSNFQAYDPAEDLRKAFMEIESFRPTESLGSRDASDDPKKLLDGTSTRETTQNVTVIKGKKV